MRALCVLTLFSALGIGAAAWAQPSAQSVEVALDKTRSVEVGFAKGLQCDDVSVVEVSLENKNAQTNVLVLRGKKLGSTTCRIGNAQAGPTVTVFVTVVKPPPKVGENGVKKDGADTDE